jgi:hypothetical protein
MKWLMGLTLAALLLPTAAVADEWKDESGKGRKGWEDRKDWNGETPGWARGRGYWDGHYPPPYPPPAWGPPGRWYGPPAPEYGRRYGGSKDDWKDWNKALREREKKLREREKEAYKKWREREKEAYKRWWDD